MFSNNSRQIGIRVKQLPPGTVQFDTLIQENMEGVLVRLPFKEANGKKLTVSHQSTISWQFVEYFAFLSKPILVRPIMYSYSILLGRK